MMGIRCLALCLATLCALGAARAEEKNWFLAVERG